MIALSYGGGTNSTAMLVGMNELGIRPDHITFADTGAEKPHTYKHIEIIDKWLIEIGFPSITVVNQLKRDGTLNQLEQVQTIISQSYKARKDKRLNRTTIVMATCMY